MKENMAAAVSAAALSSYAITKSGAVADVQQSMTVTAMFSLLLTLESV